MTAPVYEVEIFNDGWTDITPDVLEMRWKLGMSAAYDVIASPAAGQIVLDNHDGAYSPEISALNLTPGVKVRIRATYESVTHTLFTGWIAYIEVEAGSLAGRRATLHLEGAEQSLERVPALLPMMTEVHAGELIETILDHPALSSFDRALDDGVSEFSYVGDQWGDGVPAYNAIRQIAAAERGRFFMDRTGALTFFDRAHFTGSEPSDATLADEFDQLEYTYGEGLVNQVRVAVKPRGLGASGSVIWRLGKSQRIDPGECVEITARLQDAYGNPMGALSVITPVSGTDYAANSAADGSGSNLTADISFTVDDVLGSAVHLTVCNTGGTAAYLLAGSRLRGTPIIQVDSMLIERSDAVSVGAYGLRPMEFTIPYFLAVEDAEALAEAQLELRKDPAGTVKRLMLSTRTRLSDALTLTLFDRISVSETRTGHSADYVIIGEAHIVDLGGERHRTTWMLERV